MKTFFNPKTIAVIGASHEAGKIGHSVFDNLLSSWSGRVFPVNPNSKEILGQKCYKTVLEIKGKVQMAIIAVPAKIVPKVLESCGKKKIPYVVIISSGFSEAGAVGKDLEKEIEKISKKFGVSILGPNCLGFINNFKNLNASFATSKMPSKYRVGVFSQSGAMGAALLDFANGSDFGFSYFVSLGNKAGITETDLIEAWVDDESVKVAIGYLEDVKNGPEFIKAAQRFTAKKPLIILKGGMTKEGERAASLHTAALAQDETVFRAAMEEAGVILADNLNDLFELAVAFSEAPLPRGGKIAIVSNAGGPSVLAADACSREKVTLSNFSAFTTHKLIAGTNPASVGNPIDLRGDATKEDFKLALSLCQKDQAVDGILVIVSPQSMTEIEAIAWECVLSKKNGTKPILVNFIVGELVAAAKTICSENGVPVFGYPERAVRAFSFLSGFKGTRETKISHPKHKKHHVAKSLINFSGTKMSPGRLSSLLNLYGIPMAETILAKNKEEVAHVFKKIKPPVVMKISSPEILHKTDVGGILLGLETEKEAKDAFERIVGNVRKHLPKVSISGVTVMEMAREGLEVILGAKRDPVFGPVVMFGFGGIYVELIADFAVALAPLNEEKAERLIEKTKVSKIIKGYRGIKYNKSELREVIIAIGRLIVEHPEINSIEINPLVLEEGRGVLGLDAKIELVAEKRETKIAVNK